MANLLIIDDDVDMLTSLREVLAQAGYSVTGAASGQEALTLVEEARPDLVISDVRMAGMDGIQTIERLVEDRPSLKSIVITGYAAQDVPGRAMDVATSDYLCKPFTADQLLQSVERALQQPLRKNLTSYPAEMRESMASVVALEETRARAFRNFYLGVRSSHLGAAAGLAIYDQLEMVESRHQDSEKNLRLRLDATELQDSFSTVSEHCKSAGADGLKRREGGLSRIAFQPLFNNIRSGKIDCEQVKVAIQLRQKQSEEELNATEQQLFDSMWT
ncbi:MAG: response regulator [Vulcanimicrobiota bacterium]